MTFTGGTSIVIVTCPTDNAMLGHRVRHQIVKLKASADVTYSRDWHLGRTARLPTRPELHPWIDWPKTDLTYVQKYSMLQAKIYQLFDNANSY
jgi:hypothetical protein